MKKIILNFWMRRIEIKVLKLQDDERIEYLTKLLWDEVEKSNDLTVNIGTFKQIQISKFPTSKTIDVSAGSILSTIIKFKTDKY